ncbi:hypothetical protein GPK34_00625 [Secundilactobacillus kimchicus]|uniref:hypothetical protein n=1 Tax=Secundilactobacillus kimchicus TaxID=528209 RepID=UPI001C01BCB2|nr:hypothetical protein [Secundilactobacillus kimchicus]MBT9670542.1 hypothetical protein [Secundilactobacillus kimchicus]
MKRNNKDRLISRKGSVINLYELPENQALPDNPTEENGTKVLAYKVPGGQTYLRATCETYNHNKTEVHLPAESAVYWYPLYFFYDWKHDYYSNTMILKVDRDGPQTTKDYFAEHPLKIEDAISIHQPFVGKTNKILDDNLGALLELEKWGLTLMTQKFTKEDVANNYRKLEVVTQGIKAEAMENYLKAKSDNELVNPKQLHKYDEEADAQIFRYASDDAKRLLILIGVGEKMTFLMNKIVLAKTYYPKEHKGE